MTKEEILKGNQFKNCSKKELSELWDGLKDFYEKGFYEINNPLKKYKDYYCSFSPIGVVETEKDLLRAIACNIFE